MNQASPQLNPEQLEKLKQNLKGDTYIFLVTFLQQAVDSLKDIDKVASIEDPIAQAVEVRAQFKAHKHLTRILGRIIDIMSPEKDKIDFGKNDYGVDLDEPR